MMMAAVIMGVVGRIEVKWKGGFQSRKRVSGARRLSTRFGVQSVLAELVPKRARMLAAVVKRRTKCGMVRLEVMAFSEADGLGVEILRIMVKGG